MKKRFIYSSCFFAGLAWGFGSYLMGAMVVSPRSSISSVDLASPKVPKTPNNSPRDDEKKAANKASSGSVAMDTKESAAAVMAKLQQGQIIMKHGVLMPSTLADRMDRDEKLYPIHWAVRRNNPVKLKKLLQCHDYNVNERDSWGATPLYWAALGLGAGCGAPDRDRRGEEMAVNNDDDQEDGAAQVDAQNNLKCFELLLAAGANTNICTETSAVDFRLMQREEVVDAGQDRLAALESTRLCKVGGDSVAHVLCALSNVEEVRLTTWLRYVVGLIEHFADFDIKNYAGLKPIELVDRKLRTSIQKIITEKQAEVKQEMDRIQTAYLARRDRLSGVLCQNGPWRRR